MNEERKFSIRLKDVDLLNDVINREIYQVTCIQPSNQKTTYEPGILCQGVFIKFHGGSFIVHPVCEDLIDIEVFGISAELASDASVESVYGGSTRKNMDLGGLGNLVKWKAINTNITYERRNGIQLNASIDRSLLFQFEDGKRLLIKTSDLPYFVQCFFDKKDIDAELAIQ